MYSWSSKSARLLCAGLAVGVATTALAACGSSSKSSSATTTGNSSPATGNSSPATAATNSSPYVWGVDAELSGPVSTYGNQIVSGVQAYANEVNASGGINGHKINVVKLDNAGSESQAATDETELITADKAIAVFGSVLSADCTAITPIAQRYQVPTACLSVDSPNPWIYLLGADNLTADGPVVSAAQKLSGKSNPKIAVMYLSTLTATTLAKGLPAAASAAGASVVSNQQVAYTATDYSVPVASVVASKPDVVVVTETGPAFVGIYKDLQASGLNVPILYVDGVVNIASLLPLTGTNVYPMGQYPVVDPTNTDASTSTLVAALKTVGVTPTVSSVNGTPDTAFLTATAFGDALKACGNTCDGSGLAAALNHTNISFGALLPTFAYTATNHDPWPTWFVFHLQNGATTPIGSYPGSST